MPATIGQPSAQNGCAILEGINRCWCIPGFCVRRRLNFPFFGANPVFILRHRSRGWIQAFLSAEKAASLFVQQPVGNGPSRSTPKHFPTTQLQLLSPTGCWAHDFEFAVNLNSPSLDSPSPIQFEEFQLQSAGFAEDRPLRRRARLLGSDVIAPDRRSVPAGAPVPPLSAGAFPEAGRTGLDRAGQ